MLNTHSNTKSLTFKGLEVPNENFKTAFLAVPQHGGQHLAAPAYLRNDRFTLLPPNREVTSRSGGMSQGSAGSNAIPAYPRLTQQLQQISDRSCLQVRPWKRQNWNFYTSTHTSASCWLPAHAFPGLRHAPVASAHIIHLFSSSPVEIRAGK